LVVLARIASALGFQSSSPARPNRELGVDCDHSCEWARVGDVAEARGVSSLGCSRSSKTTVEPDAGVVTPEDDTSVLEERDLWDTFSGGTRPKVDKGEYNGLRASDSSSNSKTISPDSD